MKVHQIHQCRAFTLLEGVVVAAVLAGLVALLIPALKTAKNEAKSITCNGQLKEVGLAFRIWEDDHPGQYPMTVSATNGGAMELWATGNVAACFQVMSNELSLPVMLICPADAGHPAAPAWDHLGRSNVSYFIGTDAAETNMEAMLAGDANLLQNGRAVSSGLVCIGTNTIRWTQERHRGSANVLICDGSVNFTSQIGVKNSDQWVFSTNSVVVP